MEVLKWSFYTPFGKNDSFFNVKEVLKVKFEISDRLLLKLKKNNKILLNSNVCSVSDKVTLGDTVSFNIDFEENSSNIVPAKINLNIIYEDEAYIVINKPAGIPVHPSILHYENSLSNGVKYYFDTIGLKKKIRPVNRLDKDTSGIVIFAKNEYIQECLVKQMKQKIFSKEYIAICEGIFENRSGTINAPIARKENSIIERCVHEDGDASITHYNVLKTNFNCSIVKLLLETGRTHQIRVHLSYIGHPILGDTLYGNASTKINRQALHALKVSFVHPISRKEVCYIAPLPNDIKSLL